MDYLINPIQKLEVEDDNLQPANYPDICYNSGINGGTISPIVVNFFCD